MENKVTREEVNKTAEALSGFVFTLKKLQLLDTIGWMSFKAINLPWYAAWTLNLRKMNNQQSLQQRHESE